MTRGNQRDIDRERAKKRQDKAAAGKLPSDFSKRKLADADIMRDKQKKAEEKKQKDEEETAMLEMQSKMKDFDYLKQFEELDI